MNEQNTTVEVTVGSKIYYFTQLTYLDHDAAGEALRKDGGRPCEALSRLLDALPVEVLHPCSVADLLAFALEDEKQKPDLDAIRRWYRTPAGYLWQRHRMLLRHHPGITVEDVNHLLSRMVAEPATPQPTQPAAEPPKSETSEADPS